MSATLMPGTTPAKAITASASPTRSRASSVEKLSPTIGATSRPAAGNSDCGAGSARQAARMSSESRGAEALATICLVHILNFDLLASDALRQGGGHEPVEVAVEDIGRRRRGHAGA